MKVCASDTVQKCERSLKFLCLIIKIVQTMSNNKKQSFVLMSSLIIAKDDGMGARKQVSYSTNHWINK